jgi:type I restriction enzyme M protein
MKELKDTLWKAADKLRGSMDASQYKDVILGLVFLKYVSDAFDERRQQIAQELTADGWDEAQIAGQLDDVDEYTGNGVFWVAPQARWSYLAQHAKGLPAGMGAAVQAHRRACRRRDGPGHGRQPVAGRDAAPHLQPGQRRPAAPR